MDRSEADFGKQSSVPDVATQQNFFDNASNPGYGKAEDYSRSGIHDQEYNPTPNVDESGISHSSEGSIADHGVFNANAPQSYGNPSGVPKQVGAKPGNKQRSSSPHFLDGHVDSNAQ
jgi:hypothetical protein